MYTSRTSFRIRYSETDKMGYCYYGNYAQFFEVGRVEALRSLGVSYKDLEDSGVILPVLDFTIRYFKPAYYDDEITVETVITKIEGARIFFEYRTFKGEVVLNKASTTLVFANGKTGRPENPPKFMIELFAPYFDL